MWSIADKNFNSRLLLGTAQYPSPTILSEAIAASGTEIITVALRRQMNGKQNVFWEMLRALPCTLLPNTAGCFSAKEAYVTAQMARELFETNWIKLEVIGDDYTLQPNCFELIKAAELLVKDDFIVLPYCTEDFIVCQRLLEVGCSVLMPWAAPIGSGQGIVNPYGLRLLRARLPKIPLIVDAGIGKPSDAVWALEMGFDAVLLNSAVALAGDPIQMAKAFAGAIQSGRLAYEAGLMTKREVAKASTPVVGQPFRAFCES